MNYYLDKSEMLYRGKVFDLQVDHITYKSGNKGVREIAVHPGGAVVVPITSEGKVVLVTQFRYPHQKVLLEMPAGKLDKGEDPKLCAIRELAEETGYRTKRVDHLGSIATTPGFCTEILHIYLAKDLAAGEHSREEGEQDMQVVELTFEEVEEKIITGEMNDAKSISALFMAKLFIQKEQ